MVRFLKKLAFFFLRFLNFFLFVLNRHSSLLVLFSLYHFLHIFSGERPWEEERGDLGRKKFLFLLCSTLLKSSSNAGCCDLLEIDCIICGH